MNTKRINALEESLGLKEMNSYERFRENPNAWTLGGVAKREQTLKDAKIAVKNDGMALGKVAKRLYTPELCRTAVCQNGMALKYVPAKYMTDDMIAAAVSQNGRAIEFVPADRITKELAKIAVCQPIKREKWEKFSYPISHIPTELIDEQLVLDSIMFAPRSLKVVPEEYVDKDLLYMAVSSDGMALEYVPNKRMGKKLIDAAISNRPEAIKFVPDTKITKQLCDKAFELDTSSFNCIPDSFKGKEMCLAFINTADKENSSGFALRSIPHSLRNDRTVVNAIINKFGAEFMLDWNEKISRSTDDIKPLSRSTIKYLMSQLPVIETRTLTAIRISEEEISDCEPDTTLVKDSNNKKIVHDLTESDNENSKRIYYISDIHLEHQFLGLFVSKTVSIREIGMFLEKKVSEMLEGAVNSFKSYLLIAGDVGSHKDFVTRFYKILSRAWNGEIISVLGNHELWDDQTENKKGYVPRTVDEIVADYRERLDSVKLLHNELFIRYKDQINCVISEEQILTASDEDLREVLNKSSVVILGGTGFSGENIIHNADSGLYRSTVRTIKQDIELTEKFRCIYEKVKRCAEDMRVIVLTHNPVHDWTKETYVSNWVYINGHTHHNSLIRKIDGTTVFSDNQVGYNPTKFKLNAFTVQGAYDPLKNLEDGIHEISIEMYKDFYKGRGISISYKSNDGVIYVLKRNNMYMFILKSGGTLYLLVGGKRSFLDNSDIHYYYDNMIKYIEKVKTVFSPYQNALKKIGKEIKKIGGYGTVHGCIADIDFFCHIYLNPYDGKITPYFASDTKNKWVYAELTELIKKHCPQFQKQLEAAYDSKMIPVLSKYAIAKANNRTERMSSAIVPQLVLDTEIYKESRIMKSIQYIFDENIIRVWKDEILYTDFGKALTEYALE